MIRGVSRQIIEVKETGNVYYERAYLVVRPEYARAERELLEKEARKILRKLDEKKAAVHLLGHAGGNPASAGGRGGTALSADEPVTAFPSASLFSDRIIPNCSFLCYNKSIISTIIPAISWMIADPKTGSASEMR